MIKQPDFFWLEEEKMDFGNFISPRAHSHHNMISSSLRLAMVGDMPKHLYYQFMYPF